MELRFAGMIIGILVSFASAWVPFEALGLPGLFGPFGVGIAGAPVAALLGWCLSPSHPVGILATSGRDWGRGGACSRRRSACSNCCTSPALAASRLGPEGIGETAGEMVVAAIFGLGLLLGRAADHDPIRGRCRRGRSWRGAAAFAERAAHFYVDPSSPRRHRAGAGRPRGCPRPAQRDHRFVTDQGTRRSAPSMALMAVNSGASGSISTSHDAIRSGPARVATV